MNVWGTFVEHVGELFEEHLGGGESTRRYCDVGGPANCKPPPHQTGPAHAGETARAAADRFCKSAPPTVGRSVLIIRYNRNVTGLFCKFSCIFATFLQVWPVGSVH